MSVNKKISKKIIVSGRSTLVVALALLISLSTVPGIHRLVYAVTCNNTSDCQAQIKNTTNVISSSQQQLTSLAGQAANYQDAVNGLQSQISTLQSQISDSQNQQASLQQQIVAAQAQLDQEKGVLADLVRTMYIDGQMSTIEELATSSDLSAYVDKETYRQQVQNSIQDTMSKITAMQTDLNSKKNAVDSLITNQQTQASQLANARQQQTSMLALTQSQQASYNQQLAASKSNLSQLQARLTALNTTADSKVLYSGTCGGGYPSSATNQKGGHWGCNFAQDNTVDNWNMYNRECVSYTAWMAHSKYGVSTSGWGNAYQWISAAQNHGYTVNQTPSVGAIAIRNRDYSESGDVGHAMYVVAVNGSNNITVDEYNEHYNGTFDERTFSPSSYNDRGGLYYIHLH